MDAITDFLEQSKPSAEDVGECDGESQSSISSYDSVISKSQLSPSILQEAKTAALMAKLASVKKKNTLKKQISEQKSKLAELKLEMEIEQSKAQEAVFMKYCHESKPSTSKSDQYNDHAKLAKIVKIAYDQESHDNDIETTGNETTRNETTRNEALRNETTESFQGNHSIHLLKRMHLPKMAMETFNGDVMRYSGFLRQFQNNVASKTDDEEEKLYYLDQMTSGKPNDIVKTCLHLPPGEGYREARRLLDKRYGDKSRVATSLVTKILSWPPIHSNDVSGLDEYAIFLRGCLNSLKNLPSGLAEVDARAIRHMLCRLPAYATDKWRDEADSIDVNQNRCPNFEDFVMFVERLARVNGNPWYGKQFFSDTSYHESKMTKVKTMAGSSESFVVNCTFCSGAHDIAECEKLSSLPSEEKQRFVMEKGLCFGCLMKGHTSAKCTNRKKCKVCDGRHPTSLHRHKDGTGVVSLHVCSNLLPVRGCKLHVVPVFVTWGSRTVQTNAFLDSGSTHSFCSHSLLSQLNCSPEETATINLTTIQNRTSVPSYVIRGMEIKDLDENHCLSLPPLLTLDEIPVQKNDIQSDFDACTYLQEQGVEIKQIEGEVGLLLGNNAALAMEPLQVVNSENGGPFAVKTRFGWILSGGGSLTSLSVNSIMATNDWEKINEINGKLATEEKGPSVEDGMWCVQVDASCSRTEDGKYQIDLPVRQANLMLPDNRSMAFKRLASTKKKCTSNANFGKDYADQMNELISKGYAEKVPELERLAEERVWYLPHHGVYHPRKPDKMRVVFDCAARYQGISLNDELLQGPDLTNSLVDVLLRFREERYAFMADIEAMFMMVKIPEKDRNLFRFLWWPNGDMNSDPEEYRMTRHIFGATSSPSCANYALRRTAVDFGKYFDPDVPEIIFDNFYVDDCLKSVATEEKAIQILRDLQKLCTMGGFHLSKVTSNSRAVLSATPMADRSKQIKTLDIKNEVLPPARALGIFWHVEEDFFGFDVDITRLLGMPHTRRGVLSTVASVYDPLGLACPLIMTAKIIMQELSRLHVGWDDEVPPNLRRAWDNWLRHLPLLSQLRVRRCLKSPSLGTVKVVELHHFADASEKGYGTASYIRQIDSTGRVDCILLGSKSRLAPVKSVSIPRLELSAASLAVKVNHSMTQALRVPVDRVFFWTDSTAVLRYIRNVSSRFHVFVANRLAIIHDGSDPSQWGHVHSTDNPADHVSRGQDCPHFIKNEQWISGPKFLWDPERIQITDDSDNTLPDNDPEVKKVTVAACSAQSGATLDPHPIRRLIDYYSSWWRLTRAVAWLLRLKSHLRGKLVDIHDIHMKDISEAEHVILVHEQDNVFQQEKVDLSSGRLRQNSDIFRLDPEMHDGLLRVGGRLRNSSLDYSAKHPILLPSRGRVTDMLVQKAHVELGHGGREHVLSELRRKFWILNGNSAVRRVLANCLQCKRIRQPPEQQKMADLPQDRVSALEPPFTYTGIDLFGPFFVSRGRTQMKRYGVIFSCLSMRAVHLEVASSLSTDSFICAFRRFLARRGSVKMVRSDQGSNLVGAKRELARELAHLAEESPEIRTEMLKRNVQWVFNPPHASNFGGAWERMIRSTRKILDFTLHLQKLTDETLQTFLCEVEFILNSRPLTPVSTDPRDQHPLTPNDILISRNTEIPAGLFQKNDLHSKKLWRQAQYLAEQFWVRWRKSYVPLLQERAVGQRSRPNLMVGDVVVLADSSVPRGNWPFGLIKAVKTSSDGLVRSATVLTGGVMLKRPVNKMVLVVPATRP